MKIVLIDSIITPYCTARYNAISELKEIDLIVLYQNAGDVNRHWDTKKLNLKYEFRILKDIPLRFSRKDVFTFHINYRVYSELRKLDPDLVICCGWDSFATLASLIYCKLNHKRFILWSGSTAYEKSFLRTISLPYVKKVIKLSDGYISYGTKATQYLINLGANPKKIRTFYNTVDINYFSRESKFTPKEKEKFKRKLGIKEQHILMYSGQLIERKGIHTLIGALKLLNNRDVGLIVVGKGPLLEKLKKVSEGYPVYFLGHQDIDVIPKLYGISDVFILPSSEEVWGLVINEGMASGCAIVTTKNVGASVDLVKGNGSIVDANNSKKLMLALKNLLENPKLLIEAKKESLKIIKKFTIDKQVDEVFKKWILDNGFLQN